MASTILIIITLLIFYILNFFGISQTDNSIVLPFIFVFSFTYIYDITHSKSTKKLATELFIAYLLRIVLLIFDIYGRAIYYLPASGNDSEMFYYKSIYYSKGLIKNPGSFIEILGSLFKLFGSNRLFWQFILTMTSIIAILYLIKTMDFFVVDEKTKHLASWIISILPNYAMQSSIFLREAVISMCVSISVYLFVKWMYKKKEVSFLLSILFSVLGAILHSGVVGFAIGYIIIRFLYDNKNSCYRITPSNVIITIVLVFTAEFIYLNYGDILFPYLSRIKNLETMASGEGLGGSTYAQYVGDSSTPLNLVIYTIPRIVYFLFSPFVWQWRGISDIIATVFDSLFYIISVFSIFRNLKVYKNENTKVLIALVIATLCTLIIYGWGASNTGTAIRHRDKMITVFVLFWAISKPKMNQWKV